MSVFFVTIAMVVIGVVVGVVLLFAGLMVADLLHDLLAEIRFRRSAGHALVAQAGKQIFSASAPKVHGRGYGCCPEGDIIDGRD